MVEDVDWHKHHSNIFASVGDDSKLLIWDSRGTGDPTQEVSAAHDSDVNCVSFNPFNEYLLATGGSDHVIGLWDLRNMKQKLHTFEGHQGGVYQVSWSPFNEQILGSCSSDRRMHIWDLGRIGNLSCINAALFSDWFIGRITQVTNRLRKMPKTGRQSYSSCTVGIQLKSPISLGMLGIAGSWQVFPRTTYCKFGKWYACIVAYSSSPQGSFLLLIHASHVPQAENIYNDEEEIEDVDDDELEAGPVLGEDSTVN